MGASGACLESGSKKVEEQEHYDEAGNRRLICQVEQEAKDKTRRKLRCSSWERGGIAFILR